jgi:ketosteroid isomerase-like protein
MSRSPQEVFADHLAALASRDVTAIGEDYADDAVFLTSQGAVEGREAIEQFFRQAIDMLPDVEFQIGTKVFGGDALLVWWTATATAGHVDDGVDTLRFSDGMIQLQASSFTIEPNSPDSSWPRGSAPK